MRGEQVAALFVDLGAMRREHDRGAVHCKDFYRAGKRVVFTTFNVTLDYIGRRQVAPVRCPET